MALPTALWATVASFGLVTAALLSSVHAQKGSVRDQDSKEAIAAADAGANIALLRQNKITTTVTSPCVGAGGGGTLVATSAASDGWCPAISGTVGDTDYSYRTSPMSAGQMTIVSTGNSDGVTRRIAVTTRQLGGDAIFASERAIGQDWIHLDGNADVRVNMGTNGDVELNSNATVCGNIRYGTGQDLEFNGNSRQCSGYTQIQGNRTLPPLSEEKRLELTASNSNHRFFSLDTVGGNRSDVTWNTSTRVLSLNSNSTLTMGGTDYLVCRLLLNSNSQLIMPAGAQVRIYFDTPEACGLSSGTAQIYLDSNSSIVSTAFDPDAGVFDVPGLYMFGSETIATSAIFNSNSQVSNEFVLYAPRTDIEMNSNSTFVGALAGKTLHLDSNAKIISDPRMRIPELDVPPIFERLRYVECTGPATTPSSGC